MHRTNIINRVVFDIRTDAGLEAFSQEEPLEDFVRTSLIPVVDEVLRAHSTSGALISIASLEIDLGTLEHENICEKMAERLRERLDAAIRDKIRSLQGVPSRQEGVFTEPEAACRLIEQFLSTGTIPWTTDPGADLPLSRLLRNALASHGRQLVAFLKRSAPRVRKRLIRQFPSRDLIELLQLLAPDHYQLVIEAVDRVQQSTAVIPAGGETAAHLAWEQVFDYLLDREREGFRPDEFVACLISGIAVATGTNTARLVRELSASAPKLDVASESRSGLHTLFTALTGDDTRDGNEARAEDFERLKGVLVTMLEFGATSGFDTAWENLLLYYPDPTSTVIREHGKKSVVRKRIAMSFSEPQIREVIRLIEPENSEFIEAFADQSALIADDERVRPPDRSVHKKQIREFVLTYLLVDRGSRFNEKAFTGSVIRQLAAHYNWTYHQLLTSLREAVEITQEPGPMKERILGIVTELEAELEIETQPRKEPAPESRSDLRNLLKDLTSNEAFVLLKTALINMLKSGTMSGFQAAWEHLVMYYPDKTRALVTMHGKKSVVRKRIAKFFSDPQIREVICLVEPENSAFIEAFVDQSVLIADDKQVLPTDRSVHKKQIWEFVLTYLLVYRGSRFNEKAFTGSVIQQLAAHYNWTCRHLLTSLREGIEIRQSTGPMKKRILRIITELEAELEIDIQLRKKPASESLRQIRGADLYAFLDLHLMGEAVHETISGDPLSVLTGQTVRELQRYHPELLLRLLKVLQCRPDAVRRAADRLSVDRVEQLVTAFLVLFLPPEKWRQAELHASIARWADRAPDRRRYFAAILDAVVRGELIDLEAIVAGLQKQAVPVPTTGVVTESPVTESYLTWLLKLSPLDFREKAMYRLLLERFITNPPQAVGRYLIGMIKEPSLCEAFVQQTPWRLIRKAMTAMAGFTDARRYVAILEGVFRPGTPAARCRPTDFVKVVIGVFAKQQHADGEGFLKTAFGRLIARIGDTAARERALDVFEKIVSARGAGLRSIAAHHRDTTDLVLTDNKAPADTQTPEESAVLVYLKGDHPVASSSLPVLKKALEAMIVHTPEKLYWFIAENLEHGSITEKLIALLSEPFQARLLHLLLPRHFSRVQRYVDLLRNAAYGLERFDSPDEVNQCIWQGMFSYLLETGLRVFDEKAFVCRIVEFLAENRKNTDRAAFYADLGRQLATNIQPSTRADHQTLIRIVSEAAQQLRPSESVPPSPETQPAGTASVLDDDEEETPWDEEIYVANAGMVIASPYLPRLFELLGLTEQSRFTSRAAAERGVHLLQYMVDERTGTPEYRLVLNKVLCGVKSGIPIVRGIEITDKETEAITNMITAMIQNWKILGNTSIAGFRESFLQREARLTLKNDAWHLQVEERAFDMLLDQIPWSFSTIKYSWMDRVIFVKWR